MASLQKRNDDSSLRMDHVSGGHRHRLRKSVPVFFPIPVGFTAAEPWRRTYGLPDSRADILANILLYLPFGFFAIQALRRRAAVWQVAAVTFAGMALSTAMELLQFYVPGRDSSLADVGSNTLGSLRRCMRGSSAFREIRSERTAAGSQAPVECSDFGLLAWLPAVSLCARYRPPQVLACRPAVACGARTRAVGLVPAYGHLAGSGSRIGRTLDTPWKRFAFPLLVPLLLGSRILIVDAVLSPAEVLGAVIALLCWVGFLARLPVRNG